MYTNELKGFACAIMVPAYFWHKSDPRNDRRLSELAVISDLTTYICTYIRTDGRKYGHRINCIGSDPKKKKKYICTTHKST